MGALLLASKLTENIRRVRDIVNVIYFVSSKPASPIISAQRDTAMQASEKEQNDDDVVASECHPIPILQTQLLAYVGTEYYEWRDRATFAEAVILREIGFQLEVNLPYGLLINYAKVLEVVHNTRLMSKALGYMNDSFRTPANILFQPNVMACASILLAARDSKHGLPKCWHDLFDADARSIECACRLINNLYTEIGNHSQETRPASPPTC